MARRACEARASEDVGECPGRGRECPGRGGAALGGAVGVALGGPWETTHGPWEASHGAWEARGAGSVLGAWEQPCGAGRHPAWALGGLMACEWTQ